MTRTRRLLAVWGVPPVLFSWEVILGPMPWTSLRDTTIVAALGVAAIPAIVYLRQTKRLSIRAGYVALFLLTSGLGVSMVYCKPITLPFFDGVIALGYSLLVTSTIRVGVLFLGAVAMANAIAAMNTTGAARVLTLAVSCALSVWIARTWRGSSIRERPSDVPNNDRNN